jgi:hypothetical protein
MQKLTKSHFAIKVNKLNLTGKQGICLTRPVATLAIFPCCDEMGGNLFSGFFGLGSGSGYNLRAWAFLGFSI